MKRPSKIRILNHDFKINWIAGPEARRIDTEYGSMCHVTQIIQINCDRSLQAQADTLLHEIIHAIVFFMGLEDMTEKLKDDEDVVGRISTCLCTVWLHNPKVIRWLDAAISNRIR